MIRWFAETFNDLRQPGLAKGNPGLGDKKTPALISEAAAVAWAFHAEQGCGGPGNRPAGARPYLAGIRNREPRCVDGRLLCGRSLWALLSGPQYFYVFLAFVSFLVGKCLVAQQEG